MAGVRRFQDLDCWKLAMDLGDLVVALIETAPAKRDLHFCDQIRRAADKIAPQIAEGFARYTPAQTACYLRFAKGSLAEVQTHTQKAKRRRYFSEQDQQRLETLADRTSAAVTEFLKDREAAAERQRRRGQKRERETGDSAPGG
jgi:four helix bundle protein